MGSGASAEHVITGAVASTQGGVDVETEPNTCNYCTINKSEHFCIHTDAEGVARIFHSNDRLVVFSSDTPDKDDFESMIKTAKVEYDYHSSTAESLIELIEEMVRLYSPRGKGFKSIAFACHGPQGSAAAEAAQPFCWELADGLAVTSSEQILDEEHGVRKVMNALGNGVEEGGRIDLFACSLYKKEAGKAIFNAIETATASNFAASDNLSGNPVPATTHVRDSMPSMEPKKGCTDWVMESDQLDVRDLYFFQDKMAAFSGTFDRNRGRRRLMMAAVAPNAKAYTLDGVENATEADATKADATAGKGEFSVKEFATLSTVGYVPGNPHKINQDRSCALESYMGDPAKSFWAVFDGHGSVGHDAAEFAKLNLHKLMSNSLSLEWKNDVAQCISEACVECNGRLAHSSIDCTFSGTTVIAAYIDGKTLYSANVGDSRAVLAKEVIQEDGPKSFKAVDLSDDHKPKREDETARIKNLGRVQACKGMRGEDIGPQRVWLKHEDVPGLAMTRSFGDLIAASVGVIPEPEVRERTVEPEDAFIILASDGVWEFISSQEAVDIVAKVSTSTEAVKALVDEASKRWKDQEDVVDDITALIVYFKKLE